MQNLQTIEQSAAQTAVVSRAAGSLGPQTCATCGTAAVAAAEGEAAVPRSYVYAVGRIEHRFPNLSVENELKQTIARLDTKGLTDRQVLHAALSKVENRYLVRQLCWVMSIAGLETYIVLPRDPGDYGQLLDTLRPTPQPGQDLEVVVGVRGPLAPPEMCNGLVVPIVGFDQIYSFDRHDLIKTIPKPDKIAAKDFGPAAEDLLDRVIQMADNAGETAEHRALNYMVMRYHAPYAKVAEAFARNASLSSVDVQRDTLSGVRNVMKVILSFTDRATDVVEKFFLRVDVTEEFPFLVTKLSPYFDR